MDSRMHGALAAAVGGLWAVPTTAQTVVDGDPIKVDGTNYRIWGIDAPETKQECPDGWPVGRLAPTRITSSAHHGLEVSHEGVDRRARGEASCWEATRSALAAPDAGFF